MTMADIGSVMWKEWKSLLRWRGGRTRAVLTLLVPFGAFVLYMPLEVGPAWVARYISILPSLAVPLLTAILVVPDSFAGERERRTLATLLASRLSDRAILYGKLLFAAGLAWGMTLATLVLGLVTLNIAHAGGGLLLFAPRVALVDLLLSFLVTAIAVSAGTLISLRAGTTQEAHQTMTAALFLPPTLLGPLVLLLGNIKPEWELKNLLSGMDEPGPLLIIFGSLAVLALALFRAARVRFRRARLLLD